MTSSYRTKTYGYGANRRHSKFSNKDLAQESEENRLYWDSRHILNWIGLRGDESTEEGKQINAAIDAAFQELNIIEAVVLRQSQALLARDPVFYVTEEPEFEVTFFDELWRRTTKFYSESHLDPIKLCTINSMLDEYAFLRVALVENLAEENIVIVHCPHNESIEVIERSPIGELKRVHYYYTDESEYDERGQVIERKMVEVQYVKNRITHIERRLSEPEGEIIEEFSLDLGARLTIVEMTRPAFVTASMRSLQDSVSHSATQIPRGVDVSHHSRLIFNALPPGEFREDATGQKEYIVNTQKMAVRPGSYNFIPGIPFEHENSEKVKGYTNPSMAMEEAADIGNFLQAVDFGEARIYLAARMGHILSNAEEISGRSRVVLRDDHVIALQEDARRLEEIISSAFSIAWAIDTNNAIPLSLQCKLRPDAGKPSPEEQREIRANYQDGLISRKTAIALLGYVDSAEAEVQRIIEEEEDNMKIKKAKGEPTGIEQLTAQKQKLNNFAN